MVLCGRYSIAKAFCIAFVMTFFSAFDVPVFWPILLFYWVVLFVLTMRRQIVHMIKYKYVPFSFGKQVCLHPMNKPIFLFQSLISCPLSSVFRDSHLFISIIGFMPIIPFLLWFIFGCSDLQRYDGKKASSSSTETAGLLPRDWNLQVHSVNFFHFCLNIGYRWQFILIHHDTLC